MRQRIDYKQRKKIVFYKRDVGILVLTVSILALQSIYTISLNRASTSGIGLGELQDQIKEVKKKNSLLYMEILNSMSYRSIKEEAISNGFVYTTNKDVILIK